METRHGQRGTRNHIISNYIGIFFVASFFQTHLQGAVGCMVKSKRDYFYDQSRVYDCRPDYKELEFVDCGCPCWQYPQLAQYGRCSRCDHFRRPVEFS